MAGVNHALCSTATDADWEELYNAVVVGYPGYQTYPAVTQAEKDEINGYQCGETPAAAVSE